MKKANETGQKKLLIGVMIALVAIVVICVFNHRLMQGVPFTDYGEFRGPTAVFGGASGRTYVIDNGKKSVLILNAQEELERDIRGGSKESGFYYASVVEEGVDGSIYIADVLYSGEGTRLGAERILRYSADGEYLETMFEIDYPDVKAAPFQYGRIQALLALEDALLFPVLEEEGVAVYTLTLSGREVERTYYALPGRYINHAGINPNTQLPIFATRLGEVCAVQTDGSVRTYVDKSAGKTAWRVFCNGEDILYTDLASKTVFSVAMDGSGFTRVLQGGDILYTVHQSENRILSTDYVGYYIADDSGLGYVSAAVNSQAGLRALLWALAIVGILLILGLLIKLVLLPFIRREHNATLQRVAIVVVVSICIGVTASTMTMNYMVNNQNATIMEHLNLFDDILVEAVDVESLVKIDTLEDYRGEAYLRVKEPLDQLMEKTYSNGLYYYYAIYVTDHVLIYGVMDYEDTVTTRHPVYPWGAEGYTEVLTEGLEIDVSADVSSYGSWSFVLKPVRDADGTPVAIMEVGVNLDDMSARNRALVINIALAVAAMAVVLLMVIIEAIFYVEYRERRRVLSNDDISVRFPLRTLIFLVFLADCMQDAFVSRLASELYVSLWGLPRSVGAALPLSAQVLASAISALTCGSLARKVGVKKTLVAGLLLQIVGFVICGVFMDYASLLGGKAVIGMGMGLVIVSLNSIAALGRSEEQRSVAFTAISAGTLAGVTAGSGVGSLVLSFGSHATVYYVAAGILILALFMAFSGADYRQAEEGQKNRVGVLRFLLDRKVLTFLLLMLMPFLIALSFREYFFPIFATEAGMSEVDIGRIYLLCGLTVIYMGPALTRGLLARLGAKWTVIFASILICAATLLFALVPTLSTAIVGVVLLAIAISFGYTAQSTYYASLPGVKRYGESRAMGVYSLFDNGGQTLGPTVYGIALLAGVQRGLLLIGIALIVLIGLFVLLNMGGGKNEKHE